MALGRDPRSSPLCLRAQVAAFALNLCRVCAKAHVQRLTACSVDCVLVSAIAFGSEQVITSGITVYNCYVNNSTGTAGAKRVISPQPPSACSSANLDDHPGLNGSPGWARLRPSPLRGLPSPSRTASLLSPTTRRWRARFPKRFQRYGPPGIRPVWHAPGSCLH